MRFSKLLQVGAVGTLVLTPALAQDSSDAQNRALQTLRSELTRDNWQQKFDERERVRQEQRLHEAAAARTSGLVKSAPKPGNDPYSRATAILRGEASPAPTMLLAAADPASTPALAPITSPPTDAAAQEKALEILRQTPPASAAKAPAAPVESRSTPEPTPETRERVRQILDEQAPPRQPRNLRVVETAPAAPATEAAPISSDAETRARELLRQKIAESKSATPSAPATPALDAKTKEMLRRQDEEIARRAASPALQPAAMPAAPRAVIVSATPPAAPAFSADAEEKARQALREATPAQPVSAPAAPVIVTEAPAVIAPAPLPQAPAPVAAVPFSPKAEEKARQAIREKSQPPTAPASAAAAAAAHAQTISASTPAPQPAAVEPAAAAGPKSKREKLDELNALYRADKVTPAEYHERRARILAEP